MSEDDQMSLLQSELAAHMEEFKLHVQEEQERWGHLITVQESNTRVVSELAIAVTAQAEATKDMIEAWNAAHGALKVGGWLIDFIKWCSGIAVVGVGAAYVMSHLKL